MSIEGSKPGADIEKELALKYKLRRRNGWLESLRPDGRWQLFGELPIAGKVFAALLAEAGERAKLEAELNSKRERVLAILNLLTGFEAEFLGRYRYHDTCLSCAVKVRKAIDRLIVEVESWPAELRASTEAERARGLEAQLETLRVYVQSIVDYDHAKHCSGEHHCASCINGRAALSQLPTPKKV